MMTINELKKELGLTNTDIAGFFDLSPIAYANSSAKVRYRLDGQKIKYKKQSIMKTKKEFIEYLNEIGECLPSENFIMAGKMRRGKYGELLKRHDPIAFEVGFYDYKQSEW